MSGGNSKPAKENAWLWQNKAFSDVTLLVYPAGDGPDGAWTSGKPEPLARLPLHASVLASVSPEHYRCHLLRLWQDKGQGTDDQPAVKRAKASGSEAPGNVLELQCFPGEPAAVPEAVMHHAYTGILPDDASLLAWMMWRADYLDMIATVEACLAKLQTIANGGKLTAQDLSVISSLPALQSGNRAVAEQQVAQMVSKVLVARMGVAHHMLAEDQSKLLEQFVQMPFHLLKQWATLASIKLDSENTMAVLITAWYDHQRSRPPPATAPTEQQCKELSALIYLDRLSLSFHSLALPHLKWYRAPVALPQQHAVVRMLTGMVRTTSDEGDFRLALASGGGGRRLQTTTISTWTLSQEQLQQLWKHRSLTLGDVYFSGFMVYVWLSLTTHQTAGTSALCLHLKLKWPAVLLRHMGSQQAPEPVAAVHVRFEVGTGEAVPGNDIIMHKRSRGLNVSKQPLSRVEELVSFMGPESKVKVTLSKIR